MASTADCVFLCSWFSSTVPKWLHYVVKPVVTSLEKYIPQPYAGEIRGMASHFNASLSDMLILNFAYEITAYVCFWIHLHICNKVMCAMQSVYTCARLNGKSLSCMQTNFIYSRFCTSIIAQDRNGSVYHGRNLDYPHPVLRNLTFNVIFHKKGQVKYAPPTS